MSKILSKELQDIVHDYLIKYPLLRDNDSRLIVNIWADDIGYEKLKSMSATDLMIMVSKDKLPSSSTIRRIRRKLQEVNVSLRGKRWDIRHKKLEPEVKKEIKDPNNWRIKYD